MPDAAEVARELRHVTVIGMRFQDAAILEFIDLCRPGETQRCEFGGEYAGMRRLSGMQAFAHGAVGIEGPGARTLGAGEAERPRGLFGIQFQQRGARRRCGEGPVDAGDVPATQSRRRRVRGEAGADHGFVAGGNRGHQRLAVGIEFLRHRQRGRHRDCTRVQFGIVIIVELEGMRGDAIDQRRIGHAQ